MLRAVMILRPLAVGDEAALRGVHAQEHPYGVRHR
jgi:hypothetical protein